MTNVEIFYGSKTEFQTRIPSDYINLTNLIFKFDRDNKTIKFELSNSLKKSLGTETEDEAIELPKIENFVVFSEEYSSASEHVIMNFNNFISQFDITNIYLQNPPIQISNQISHLYPSLVTNYQKFSSIGLEEISTFLEGFDDIIVGQNKVKRQLTMSLFKLTNESRVKPLVILFYGKSGVGKTETAKYLAKTLDEKIFRKQFSMYQNSQFSTYLFGGTHNEKSFAKELLERNSNVILLDEFDKAHSSFHSAFYQLFDEGVFEDQNYCVELEKSIIICTSNYSSREEIEEQLGSAIFNRFDNIIHFDDLSEEAKVIIGSRCYEKYSKSYGVDLDGDIKANLFKKYSQCENSRQINNLVEDTIALVSINEQLNN